MLDHDICYDALLRRDHRYDGLFFVAVRTTGIYCRPVCPARTPLRRNVTFYETPPQAEEAGYRPCLRCRPESAPDSPAWLGSQATVNRALRLIEEGALAETLVSDFAERLGVTDRHLRRLFLKHLGVGPLAVEQTRRVHLAKKLLHETRLSMTDVAFAAGFGSLRRFNETFRQLFRRPPSAIGATLPGAGRRSCCGCASTIGPVSTGGPGWGEAAAADAFGWTSTEGRSPSPSRSVPSAASGSSSSSRRCVNWRASSPG